MDQNESPSSATLEKEPAPPGKPDRPAGGRLRAFATAARPFVADWVPRLVVLALIAAAAFAVIRFFKTDLSHLFKKSEAAYVFEDMHLRIWHKDKPQWEIWARRVEVFKDRDEYIIEGINKGMFTRAGKTYYFTAERGVYNSRKKTMVLHGGANFITDSGDGFRTSTVEWNGQNEILTMPFRVQVVEDGNTYEADSLEAKGGEMERLFLRGDVKVRVPDMETADKGKAKKELEEAGVEKRDAADLRLTAQRVEYDGKTKIIKCMSKRGAELSTGPVPLLYPENKNGLPPPTRLPKHGDLAALKKALTEELAGAVTLATRGMAVEAQDLIVDTKSHTANAKGRVRVVRRGRTPDADRRKVVQALQKRDTLVLTDKLTYAWRMGRLDVPGSLSVQQRNLSMSAGAGTFMTRKETFQLRDGVRVYQSDGKWLFQEKIIEEDERQKVKDVAREATTLLCRNLDVDMNKDDLSVTGGVRVIQTDRLLTAQTALYEGDTETWLVYGGVTVRDRDDLFVGPMFEYNKATGELTAASGAAVEIIPGEEDRLKFVDFFEERDEDFDPASLEHEKIYLRGNHMYYNEDHDELTITGDAHMQYKDVTVAADTIRAGYSDDTVQGRGNVVIKDKMSTTTGDRFDADWNTDDYTVQGGVKLDFKGRRMKEKKDTPFKLSCRRLDFNSETRRGKATGRPVLTTKDRRATSDQMVFDLEDDIFVLDGAVNMHQEDGDWLRDKDYIDADDKQAWSVADKTTDVTCERARFETERDYFLLTGGATAVQKDKTVTSQTMEFFGKSKRLILEGDVHLHQENGDWLFEGEFIEEDEDEDVKDRVRDTVDVYTDRLESHYGEKKLHLSGGFVVNQDKSSAEGDTLWYYGEEKLTVIEGNVSFKDEDGSKLKAKRLVYDGKRKTLEAFQKITGSGFVDKKR